MQKYKCGIIIMFLFCLITVGSARHIVGGDVSYSFVEFNPEGTQVTFLVRFNMYRDRFNNGPPFDIGAQFGIYQEQADGTWEFYASAVADPEGIDTIQFIDDPCIQEDANVGVQSAYYEFEIVLDIIDHSYMVAYQACCRNLSSSNIFNEEVGSLFDIIITSRAQQVGNNSAIFTDYPPLFICAGIPLLESVQASDIDGDLLLYSLCSPLQSGGVMGGGTDPCLFLEPDVTRCLPPFGEISFLDPYSAENPMGGRPQITLNNNGYLSGIPDLIGQFVVGVCVDEYRNGVLLNKIRRDFQFNIVPCEKAIATSISGDSLGVINGNLISYLSTCSDSSLNLGSTTVGSNVSLFHWKIEDPNGNIVLQESGSDISTVDLQLDAIGFYKGYIAVNDNTVCKDTAFFEISNFPSINSDIDILSDPCFPGPVTLLNITDDNNLEVSSRSWKVDGISYPYSDTLELSFDVYGNKSIELIQDYENNCVDYNRLNFDYNPPYNSFSYTQLDTTICYLDSILINNQWMKQAGLFTDTILFRGSDCDSLIRSIYLRVQDMPYSTDLDTTICAGDFIEYYGESYSTIGIHEHVTLSKISDCDSIYHRLVLNVEEFPTVDFAADSIVLPVDIPSPMPVTVDGDYSQITWSPSDGLSCSDCPDPIVDHDWLTDYKIDVVTSAGCLSKDSILIQFVFIPDRYYYPTLLNSDNNNSNLFLQTYSQAESSVRYDLTIYDRWGTILYRGSDMPLNDSDYGWNSRNTLPGVYIYKFDIHEYFESRTEIGTITVVN